MTVGGSTRGSVNIESTTSRHDERQREMPNAALTPSTVAKNVAQPATLSDSSKGVMKSGTPAPYGFLKPYLARMAWPAGDSTKSTKACACGLRPLRVVSAMG